MHHTTLLLLDTHNGYIFSILFSETDYLTLCFGDMMLDCLPNIIQVSIFSDLGVRKRFGVNGDNYDNVDKNTRDDPKVLILP